ncbi:hypothetical protein ZWY2020_054598 [Hordeum vulgare]|nr:hypothetical protein ZWY2020_054598 [Hordeum vulgare]
MFESPEEAYEFYNMYSWGQGFGIRYSCSRAGKKGKKTRQDLVCACEVLVSIGCTSIPAGLILKRWTRQARDGVPVGSDGYVQAHGDSSDRAAMYCFIYASAMELVSMATKSRPAFEVAVDYVNRAKLDVSSMTVVPTKPALDETVQVAGVAVDVAIDTILAPPRVRSRGRPKKSRFKSPIESPGARKKKKPHPLSALLLHADAGANRSFPSSAVDKWCESSVQAVVFCQTWDGVKHSALAIDTRDHAAHRSSLLFLLIHIGDNRGRPPKQFVQDIDD